MSGQGAPRPGAAVQVGVDVGGTKVLAGVVDDSGTVVRTARRDTPTPHADAEHLEDAVVAAVLEVADGAPLGSVGVAAAGFVDAAGEHVAFAPHLAWRGEPVRQRLEARWGVPVALDNDATCAMHAEAAYGAARGAASAVLVTLGTGIGGGLVVDGRVVRGAGGLAGEFGHMQVVPGGHPCECGGSGCWEQYCSGKALARFARELLGEQPSVLEEACAGEPALLTGAMVTAAAEEGDLVARHAFAAVGDWLGVGLANLVAALDPEVLVVGGGVATAGDRLLEPARTALVRSLVGGSHRVVPPLRTARFGEAAGLVGAALLAGPAATGARGAQPRR